MQAKEVQFVPTDWGRYAECYDCLLHLKPYTAMLQEVSRASLSFPRERTLDASCGTGNFESALYNEAYGSVFPVIGIDGSDEMLARAQEKLSWSSCFSFMKADLNKRLPFEGSTFTQVVSINTLYAVENPRATLEEFYRVLKEGGRLLLVTPKHGYENGFILKAHCESPLSDAYWEDIHRTPTREEMLIRHAISDVEVAKNMLTVAEYNRMIAENATFHFFLPQELRTLLVEIGFSVEHESSTYADQDIFTIAKKGV